MTKREYCALVAAAAVLIAGCATTQQKYAWGTYDHSLYVYYKDPATAAALAKSLEATIDAAEKTNAVVGPGIYAEYGYLLLQQGNATSAIDAFRKEATHWPESKVFMDHMIQAALGSPNKSAASGQRTN
jgi:hypothetical protein